MENRCKTCGNPWEIKFYVHEEGVYCFDCLVDELGLRTETVTHYFTKEGDYITDDDHIIDYLKTEGIYSVY